MIQWTPVEPGDAPTYLAFIAATIAAFFAWRTVRGQSRQYDGDTKRRDEEARKDQAQHISTWFGLDGYIDDAEASIIISNESNEPVYDVVVCMVFLKGSGPRVGEELSGTGLSDHVMPIPVLPPGKWIVKAPPGWRGMQRIPGAEIAFSDRFGHHWLRRPRGLLFEISKAAPEHYALELPHGWVIPQAERA